MCVTVCLSAGRVVRWAIKHIYLKIVSCTNENENTITISKRLFCCFSFIIALINRILRLWNSGGKILRDTWGGPIQNHLCILGGPIRNRLWIWRRPIWNRLCILGGPIRKPIGPRMQFYLKESGRTGFYSGWQGCSSEFTFSSALQKSLRAALLALGKNPCALLFYSN